MQAITENAFVKLNYAPADGADWSAQGQSCHKAICDGVGWTVDFLVN